MEKVALGTQTLFLGLMQMHDGYDDGAMCVGVVAELIIALVVMVVVFAVAVWWAQ